MQALQENVVREHGHQDELRRENLPFVTRLVENEADLEKALEVRQSAYNRHVPELAKAFGKPEQCDFEPGCAVLLAESKFDGEPLGTMRIQTNLHSPLWLESSVTLPNWLQGQTLSEATRLGVAHHQMGRMVKIVLFKAYYQYCVQEDIDWMVIAGRSPLDQQYEALMFKDVFPERGFIPMKHAGNLPHRVMALDVAMADPMWRAAKHRLYNFIVRTHHPDVQIGADGGKGSARWLQDESARYHRAN